MPTATDKQQLITHSNETYNQLVELINSFSPEQQAATFPFEDRDRNIRDVVSHLHEWQLMLMEWYQQGMEGEQPIMPKQGYTWQDLPALNQLIWEKYQNTPLDTALEQFAESHLHLLTLIESHTDEQLFTKKYYPWTGSTSLGAYFVSSTSSHYEWAIKKIEQYKKSIHNQ